MKIDLATPRSRRVVRRTTHRVVGRFPSLKCRKVIHWESQLERDMARLLEFDPAVLTYAEQPEPLLYKEDGKVRKHTPDFLVETNGGPIIIEVKPYDQAISEPWRSRLLRFEAEYQKQGIRYLVMTDQEIRREPRLSNVITLLRYQRQDVSMIERTAILHEMSAEPIQLEELRSKLDDNQIARTHIYALIAQGHISIDINDELGPDTLLSPSKRVLP